MMINKFIKRVLFSALLTAAVSAEAANAFPDPGFESGKCTWKNLNFRWHPNLQPAWKVITDGSSGMKVQSQTVYSGKCALKIFNRHPHGYVQLKPPAIPVSEGKRYRLRYFVYNDSKDTAPSSILNDIYFDNAKGQQVWRYVGRFPAFTTRKNEWLPFEVTFEVPLNGATQMRIIVQAQGKNLNAYLDDFSFEEIPQPKISGRYDAARELPGVPGVRFWSDIIQVQTPYREMPQKLAKDSAIRMSAASNERECVQLILNPESDLQNVRISGLPLTGPEGAKIEAGAYKFRRIGYIDIPKKAGSKAGMRPDPLFLENVFNAPAKCNTPILVSIDVPKNTPKGLYKGGVILEFGGKRHEIPVELKVRSFELPDIATLKTFFYARIEEFGRFDNRPRAEVLDTIHEILKEHRINGNQGQTIPMPEYELKDGRLIITGFDAFDRYIQRRIDRDGMRIFPVPFLYFFGDTGGFYKGRDRVFGNEPFNSPKGRQYIADYARQFQEHVSKKFPQAEFLAYIWDEPRGNAEVEEIMKSIRKGSQDIKIFITVPLRYAYPEVNIFCDAFQPFFKPSFHKNLPNARFWLYNWPASLDPVQYFQARLYPLLVYFNDAEGALLWQIFDARPKNQNPWTHLINTYNCGSATLVYPPQKPGDSFHSTQRFAAIREGIDDFDYMKLLEKRVEAAAPGKGRAYVKAILKPIFTGKELRYHNDPALLSRLRDRLGEALDAPELDKKILNSL